MYVSAQERPLDALGSGIGGFENTLEDLADDIAPPPGDAVSRLLPPFDPISAGASLGGGAFGMLSPLVGMLGQLLSRLSGGSGGPGGIGGFGGGAHEQYYGNATASSTGDPHLAFSADGTDAHWDSMNGHADLLDSDSFRGGFRISTQTTQPGANGVTYNGSATIATQNGGTAVRLDNAGNATVMQDGRSYALGDGQSFDLGDGERVSRGADGSVEVDERNRFGGSIVTTMRDDGQGVDVNATASGVRLGGDLTEGGRSTGPLPHPHVRPMPRMHAPLPRPYRV